MSVALRSEVLPLPADLAVTANSEHLAAIDAGASALGHAIRAGDALLLARQQVEHGGWERWLAEHFDGTLQTARVYMRIARNADAVAEAAVPSIAAADRMLTTALDTRVNPAMREHVAGDIYAVLATWDLTELERLVLSGRRLPVL